MAINRKDRAMSHLVFANGNSAVPYLIKGTRRLDSARYVMLNEYGKLIDIDEVKENTPEETSAVSKAFMQALQEVIKAGRRWVQPDWIAIRDKALADLAASRQPKGPKPGPTA
jgi:hypothetical protein